MKYELKNNFHRERKISNVELIDDLKRIADQLKSDTLGRSEYNEHGKYSSATMERIFGSWNKALEKAGLKIYRERDISKIKLFKNIEEVWIKLGRQPFIKEMIQPFSKYDGSTYYRRFGTWRKALEDFVQYISSDDDKYEEESVFKSTTRRNKSEQVKVQPSDNDKLDEEIEYKHTTKRNPSGRLKIQVLVRDGNKCRLCGITVTGESIHFDHIKPWSNGGETVLENLRVLCAVHNLAKGNLDYNDK